jgi:hypothetical protein
MIKRPSIAVASGRGVAERWRRQYYESGGGKWQSTVTGSGEDIYNRLCALGPNPDIDKVAETIGNKGWAHLTCSGCGEYVATAVSFGSNYDDRELLLCSPCVKDAAQLVDRLRPDQQVKDG